MSPFRLVYAIGALAIVVVAIAARLPLSRIDLFSDGRVYAHGALALLEHGALDLQPGAQCPELKEREPATCRLPGYPLILAAIAPWAKRLEDFAYATRLLNLLADLVTAWCVVRLLAGLGVAPWLRLIGVGAVLLHPTILRFTHAGLTESLAMALTVVWVWLVLGGERCSSRRLVLSGLLLGVATLVRADFLFLVPALVTVWLVRRGERRSWPVLGLSLVCVAVPIGAWTVRNQLRTGEWMTPFAPSCDPCGRRQASAGTRAWLATWLTREEEVPLDWSLVAGQPAPNGGRVGVARIVRERRAR